MNEKHTAFAEYFLQHFNATKAYQEVFKDSSYDTARANSSALLNENPEIKEYLKNRIAELSITSNEILIGVAKIARDETIAVRDRLKAYEMLAKLGGMFIDRMDITTNGKTLSWEQIISNEGGSTKTDYKGALVVERQNV